MGFQDKFPKFTLNTFFNYNSPPKYMHNFKFGALMEGNITYIQRIYALLCIRQAYRKLHVP